MLGTANDKGLGALHKSTFALLGMVGTVQNVVRTRQCGSQGMYFCDTSAGSRSFADRPFLRLLCRFHLCNVLYAKQITRTIYMIYLPYHTLS